MLRIEGYVIISADGMLADVNRVMPQALKFKGDHEFFTAGLDRADLVVHGRNSFEDQPNSPLRKRIHTDPSRHGPCRRSGQRQGDFVESCRRLF